MSPIWWAAIAYAASGFLGAFRRIFREWADDFSPLSGADFAMGVLLAFLLGFCLGIFYPLYGVLSVATRGADFDRIAKLIAGEDPEKKRARQLHERVERKREIERLERELGIGVDS